MVLPLPTPCSPTTLFPRHPYCLVLLVKTRFHQSETHLIKIINLLMSRVWETESNAFLRPQNKGLEYSMFWKDFSTKVTKAITLIILRISSILFALIDWHNQSLLGNYSFLIEIFICWVNGYNNILVTNFESGTFRRYISLLVWLRLLLHYKLQVEMKIQGPNIPHNSWNIVWTFYSGAIMLFFSVFNFFPILR